MSSEGNSTPGGGPSRSLPGTLPMPVLPPRRPNPEEANWPPSIKILRAGTGIQSLQPDERCFTYCSQSVAGRNKGRPPFCRSLCFRRVFKHEVKQLVARSEDGRQQALFMPDADHAEVIAMYERLGIQVRLEEREIREPLPPEGQRPSAFFAGRPRTGPLPPPEATEAPRGGPMSAVEARKEARRDRHSVKDNGKDKAASAEPKVWQEGTYVWYTQNTWHAIDHLIMMRTNIQTQAAWQRYQERLQREGPELAAQMASRENIARQRAWLEERRKALGRTFEDQQETTDSGSDRKPQVEASTKNQSPPLAPPPDYESIASARPGEWVPERGAVPGFPDLEGSAILLPIAPAFPPIDQYVSRALAPAGRVLDVFARSWQSGAQQRFASKAWDKTFGDEWREPWRLLGRAWDTLRKSGGDGK